MIDCIICDLDGTLARAPNNYWYDRDYTQDLPIKETIEFLYRMVDVDQRDGQIYCYPHICFVTGRKEIYREMSVMWLDKHLAHVIGNFSRNPTCHLYMRPTTSILPDQLVKLLIYDINIKPYFNVRFVLDDRPKVVRMWRSQGLFVFEVNQRNVEF